MVTCKSELFIMPYGDKVVIQFFLILFIWFYVQKSDDRRQRTEDKVKKPVGSLWISSHSIGSLFSGL